MRSHLLPFKVVATPEQIHQNQAWVASKLGYLTRRGGLVVDGQENLIPTPTKTIIALKHLDNADPLQGLVVLFAACNYERTLRIVAKEGLFKSVLGGILLGLGVAPVTQKYKDERLENDRTAYSTLLTKTQAEVLDATPSGTLVMYPEGHRTPNGVGPIKSGAIYAAAEYARLSGNEVPIEIIGQASSRPTRLPLPLPGTKFGISVSGEPLIVCPHFLEGPLVRDRIEECIILLGTRMLRATNEAREHIGLDPQGSVGSAK